MEGTCHTRNVGLLSTDLLYNDNFYSNTDYVDIVNIVTCMSDYRRGFDSWLDLFNIYRSYLQVNIALSLIYTL